ncbi:TetR/AcrR family transcriptional regulator [Duganella aceris]|uniref:TetR/AcrR family transcriptional regulator n=1 Tax=Duganella aceris TaxID=2703883 RepID=A0ABX0FGQ7_9BURK|nr:TetR/AcrR family transcriptional regulator [Duganella aceris]NGZ83739.1 TetR/AcrR family transcriptional regulator [Duganella aceris]
MKKSKADTAETRLRIISIASNLFLTKGLADTGISDVMSAAGLTQGGFYRHFESKDQLVAEANRAANEELFRFYSEAIQGMAPAQAIETIVHLYLNQACGPGALCPLANLGSELRHADAHIREVAMEGRLQLMEVMAAMAQRLGIAEPHGVADAIVSAAVGAVTLSQLIDDPVGAQSIRDHAQDAVALLLASAPKRPQELAA